MFVCCECCVLSGRGLCDELITRPEEFYRMWCVVVCDIETSRIITYGLYQCTFNYITLHKCTFKLTRPIVVHFQLHTAYTSALSNTYSLYSCTSITYSLYKCIFNPILQISIHYSFQRRLSKLFRIWRF